MYEEWFEYLAGSLNITNVVNTKNYIDIELPKELSVKINGEELFNELEHTIPSLILLDLMLPLKE